MSTSITPEQTAAWAEQYNNCKRYRVARRALAKNAMSDVMFIREKANQMRHKFSLNLETLPVTNQKQSGRCWLFAATNILRERIAKELNLEQFELSQAYLAFYDKFERANYFFERILETASLPADDRTVTFILQTGVHDGGQWGMFANIVNKWGVVPRDVFDDTYQAGCTRDMNAYLNRALKAGAAKLRAMVKNGADDAALQAAKQEMMGRIYAYLCACYGEPPKTFDFEYVDKDKQYHLAAGMTPASFTARYVGDYLSDVVSVINAPTADKPFNKTFTVSMLGNVEGMPNVKHLNLSMEDLKASILRQMQAGKPVWFGSDVGKWGDRDAGIWDDECFDAELVTGLDLQISKEDALDLSFSAMNHAMVLTGVDIRDGKPTRWRIENSWGDERGNKGYYVCSDSWFDQYVYQAAIEKEYLGDLAALNEQEPITLAPWDPMGTLAD